jgi:competence protein ComEC
MASLADAIASARDSRRSFVLLPFATIFGMMVYAQLPFEPNRIAQTAVGVALCLLAVLLRRSPQLQYGLILLAFWAGFCLLSLHGCTFGTNMLSRPTYGAFEARVAEVVSATPDSQRILVYDFKPLSEDRSPPIRMARIVAPAEPLLRSGDIISGSMRLVPVPGPILPGAYDGQFHSYFAGIGAYGTVTSNFAMAAPATGMNPAAWIEEARSTIGRRIDYVLDGSSAAIGRAMVVGDQSAITDETRELMATSGLAHIYSISGLHLSIVAGGMFWLVRLGLAALPVTARRLPVKRIAACFGLAAAVGYLALAGGLANVPALRSALMLALIFGAVLAGRRALTMRNVALAALLIIAIDPSSVFRPSFQLSFAAVVGLIGTYELPRRTADKQVNWTRRIISTVWGTALTSFIAGTATLLFSAYHFQQTAPLGVIGNVLVLPLVSLVIMPFALLSVLAMLFSFESPFLQIMGWGIDRMVDVAALVAHWSEGLSGNPLLTSISLVIGVGALAWFAFLNSWWRFLGPALALPMILIFGFDQRPDLLIADSTQAVALRSGNSMGLITGRTGSFAVDVWSQHYQQAIEAASSNTRCDSLGCIARTEQFSVAVVKNAAAFAEDCGLNDLLIARVPAPHTCSKKQIIDADDLRTGGVHWLAWDQSVGQFKVRTAIPNVSRPWRVAPR